VRRWWGFGLLGGQVLLKSNDTEFPGGQHGGPPYFEGKGDEHRRTHHMSRELKIKGNMGIAEGIKKRCLFHTEKW